MDPLTIQAEADARIDQLRSRLSEQAREIAALKVDNAHLRSELDAFRLAKTIPAPPIDDDLPSPLAAMEHMRGPCEQ